LLFPLSYAHNQLAPQLAPFLLVLVLHPALSRRVDSWANAHVSAATATAGADFVLVLQRPI
jgi:hypothetical protein